VFLGRLRNLLRDYYTDLLGALLDAGDQRFAPPSPPDREATIASCERAAAAA